MISSTDSVSESRLPIYRVCRKPRGSQDIKCDKEWCVRLFENEINSGFAASCDFGQFYLKPLYRNVALAVESSPELISPKRIRGNIGPSPEPEFEGVQGVFKS